MANTKKKSSAQSAGTFSVRLSPSSRKELDKLAALTQRSRAFLINEAVDSYVAERAAYIQQLDEAATSVAQGPTHSSEQIFTWMRSWGTERELPSPQPDIRKRSQ